MIKLLDILKEALGVPPYEELFQKIGEGIADKILEYYRNNRLISIKEQKKIHYFEYRLIDDSLESPKDFPLRKIKIALNPPTFVRSDFFESKAEKFVTLKGFSINGESAIGNLEMTAAFFINFEEVLINADLFKKGSIEAKELKKITIIALSHELTHAYEFYQRSKTKSKYNVERPFVHYKILSNILEHIPDKSMRDFSFSVYVSQPVERNAKIAETYFELKNNKSPIRTKSSFVNHLKQTEQWRITKKLLNFDANDFINSVSISYFDVDSSTIDLIIKHTNIDKEKLKSDKNAFKMAFLRTFIEFFDEIIESESKNLFNKYKDAFKRRSKSITSKDIEKRYSNYPTEPIKFFKFWEKKFHKAGKNMQRKMLRLAPKIIDKDND